MELTKEIAEAYLKGFEAGKVQGAADLIKRQMGATEASNGKYKVSWTPSGGELQAGKRKRGRPRKNP